MTISSDTADNTGKATATPLRLAMPAVYQTRLLTTYVCSSLWRPYAVRSNSSRRVYGISPPASMMT
jgi:hypothetical protein